jgi:hypothetical protein
MVVTVGGTGEISLTNEQRLAGPVSDLTNGDTVTGDERAGVPLFHFSLGSRFEKTGTAATVDIADTASNAKDEGQAAPGIADVV